MRLSTTAASPTGSRATPTAPSPISTRRSRSTRNTRRPSTTAPSPMPPRTSSTAPSRTTTRRSSSTAATRSPSTIAAMPNTTRATTRSAIADYDSAIKLNPADTLALQQPRQCLCQPARLRPRHRRPDARRSSSIRATRRPITTAASPMPPRATSTARSPISSRRSSSTAATASPITIAASPIATSTTSTAPSRISTQAIKLNPNYAVAYYNRGNALRVQARLRPRHRRFRPGDQAQARLSRLAYYDRALSYGAKGDTDRAIADFNEAIKLDPPRRAGLLQPRHRLPAQGRHRPRHRRLRRGGQARRQVRARLLSARQRLLREARLRPRHRRFRRGDPLQPQLRPRLSITAASPIATSATTTAPSTISARRSGSTARTRRRSTIAASPIA